jgi:uncharacterized membrane protein
VFLLVKTLHVFSIAMFLGNMLVTNTWKGRSKHCTVAVRTYTNKLTRRTDSIFVEFYGLLSLASGLLLVYLHPVYTYTTTFIMWALILWTLSLVFWGVSIPYLRKQHIDLVMNKGEKYNYYDRRWWWWGLAATIADVAILPLMIWKPL